MSQALSISQRRGDVTTLAIVLVPIVAFVAMIVLALFRWQANAQKIRPAMSTLFNEETLSSEDPLAMLFESEGSTAKTSELRRLLGAIESLSDPYGELASVYEDPGEVQWIPYEQTAKYLAEYESKSDPIIVGLDEIGYLNRDIWLPTHFYASGRRSSRLDGYLVVAQMYNLRVHAAIAAGNGDAAIERIGKFVELIKHSRGYRNYFLQTARFQLANRLCRAVSAGVNERVWDENQLDQLKRVLAWKTFPYDDWVAGTQAYALANASWLSEENSFGGPATESGVMMTAPSFRLHQLNQINAIGPESTSELLGMRRDQAKPEVDSLLQTAFLNQEIESRINVADAADRLGAVIDLAMTHRFDVMEKIDAEIARLQKQSP